MRYYQYNLDYFYVGYVDSETPVSSATTIKPLTNEHVVWNIETSMWDKLPTYEKTLDELKIVYINDNHSYFDDIITSVFATLANFEPKTFASQEAEWRAWTRDNTAPTPYVDILANRRNIDKATLMGKIGQKVMFFADIQGQMQELDDTISNCVTIEELKSLPLPWL